MKREFLEGLGLESEVIEKIMAEHGKSMQAEQAKVEAKEAEIGKANETIKGLQDTIKNFDGVDVEKLQQDARDWQEKYSADLKAEQQKTLNLQRQYALKEQMAKRGVLDPEYLIYKVGGINKFTFDKDNCPVGVDEALKPYKEDKTMMHLFKQDKSPYNPQDGTAGGAVNPFAKETFNMTKQGELLKSNPEQARALAAAAGVKI